MYGVRDVMIATIYCNRVHNKVETVPIAALRAVNASVTDKNAIDCAVCLSNMRARSTDGVR